VGAVLASTEYPINLLGGGIVASDGLGGFCCEPSFAADKHQPMRPAQRAEVNWRKRFSRDEIDDGQRVVGSASIVRRVGSLAIRGGDDFVGIVADRYPRNRLQAGWIDNGEGLLGFGEHQQRILGRVLGVKNVGT